MDLIAETDIYQPSVDENGNYIDNIPFLIKHGVRCTCGSRKEHIYDSKQSFSLHIKTKTHQKWIQELNANKMNYFTENIKLNETINNINENELGELCHTYTDFHSSTLLNNRGVTAYVCVSFDHVVSPVFFSVINLHSYVNQFPENNVVHIIPHQTV